WQFPTFDASVDWSTIAGSIGPITRRRRVAQLRHPLTHRLYEFDVWMATSSRCRPAAPPRRWVELRSLTNYPFSRPQAMIVDLLLDLLQQSPKPRRRTKQPGANPPGTDGAPQDP
ncbi:MAG: hypothetical protein NZ561_05215, partial [Phycisphaerae bacterium]|nr:hypothetical protein [Phycisphaerae bacterium]MDW8261898.1 hypothetical protein [Phycisphaerales bacterium]